MGGGGDKQSAGAIIQFCRGREWGCSRLHGMFISMTPIHRTGIILEVECVPVNYTGHGLPNWYTSKSE